jgi:hypothetical protein
MEDFAIRPKGNAAWLCQAYISAGYLALLRTNIFVSINILEV